MKYAALFVRDDSGYKERACDAYDIGRDALSYSGNLPVVAHPPCRAWGMLSHMANPREGEKELAFFAINKVRECGGIIEHPRGSRLFGNYLPDVGEFPDEFGGYTIEIDQFDFGHVAHKPTKLYICGVPRGKLPALPERRHGETYRDICGNTYYTLRGERHLRTRSTTKQREYTPEKLIDWFEDVLEIVNSYQ